MMSPQANIICAICYLYPTFSFYMLSKAIHSKSVKYRKIEILHNSIVLLEPYFSIKKEIGYKWVLR